MTELTNGAITAAVRERLAAAVEKDQPHPGRRRLAADLGVTVYQIRKAMTELSQAAIPDPVPPTSGPRAPRWPLLLLALPAFVSIWGGWVGLGRLTGFGPITLLPGIWDRLEVDSAITLPIGLETYAAYALYIWLSGIADVGARRFAKISALTSLAGGPPARSPTTSCKPRASPLRPGRSPRWWPLFPSLFWAWAPHSPT